MTLPADARLLVVGAGLAGTLVAAGLREAGWAGELTVVGNEAHPPYHRPPLSKGHLRAEGTPEDLNLRDAAFLDERLVSLVLDDEVVDLGLEPNGTGAARTAGGRVLGYDRLVLATGAVPRSLPLLGGVSGVHRVRSVSDAAALRPLLREGASVVVVGAGFIGLEVAATARANGARVTVLEAGPRVLGRVLGPVTAARVAEHHRSQGIEMLCATHVVEVLTTGSTVRALVLADGTEIAADVVVLGVGADPCTELAEKAGLSADRGIVVGLDQVASDGHTLAVGDCSIGWNGVTARLESVDHATQSAAAAVATLLGTAPPDATPPWFWSDQGALKLQVVGLRREDDEVLVREDPARGKFAAIHLRDGTVVAAEVIGAPADFMMLRRAVAAGTTVSPEQRLAWTDPQVKLSSLL